VAGTAVPIARKAQRYFGLETTSGVRVMEIGKGSPAALGGLRVDDTIVAIDGIAVDGIDALQRVLDASRIDRTVEIAVLLLTQKLTLRVTPVEPASTRSG
jgi:S1-C subfamily serine protease